MKKKTKVLFGVLLIMTILVAVIISRGIKAVKGPTYISSKIWDYDFVIDNSQIILMKYKGNEENVVIPDKILFMPVVKVGDEQYDTYTLGYGVFEENNSIKSVDIPDSVKEVGKLAFNDCKNLQKVTFGNSINKIGDMAFNDCSSLEKIELPDSLKKIGSSAFADDSNITDVSLPDTVSYIGGGAFYFVPWFQNKKDEFVILGDGVLTNYQGTDKNITIPDGVKMISEGVFNYTLKDVTIRVPSTVKCIDENAVGCSATIYFHDENIDISDFMIPDVYMPSSTVVAPKGSDAAKYAQQVGIKYVEGND